MLLTNIISNKPVVYFVKKEEQDWIREAITGEKFVYSVKGQELESLSEEEITEVEKRLDFVIWIGNPREKKI